MGAHGQVHDDAALSDAIAARVAAHFSEHATMMQDAQRALTPAIQRGAEVLTQTLLRGGKVLACGNGGSAADAQHFAGEMIGRLEKERPGLPAIALTADTATLTALGNDYGFDAVFAKQVHALGAAGDALLAITTSGHSPNVLAAVAAAHEREMRVIALSGKGGGALRAALRPGDVEICVPHARTMRIQEAHIVAIHAMCDIVDFCLLGG